MLFKFYFLVRDIFLDSLIACMLLFASNWEEKMLWWRDYRFRSRRKRRRVISLVQIG